MIKLLSKIAGVIFILAAVFVWASYSYPDINPFWPGAGFAPGMIGQVLNWVLVCILAAVGIGIWKGWGKAQ